MVWDEVIVAAWNKMGEPALRPEFPDFSQLMARHDKDGNQTIEFIFMFGNR